MAYFLALPYAADNQEEESTRQHDGVDRTGDAAAEDGNGFVDMADIQSAITFLLGGCKVRWWAATGQRRDLRRFHPDCQFA